MDTPTMDAKPPETIITPPAGGDQNPVEQQGPSAEELRKQNEDLQKQIKDRDTQIADLNTTKATLEARYTQVNQPPANEVIQKTDDIKERTKRILQNAAYDPDSASVELANLLTETSSKASREAVVQAQQAINSQNFVTTLKAGVKTSNPEFDDEIVELIINRADEIAVKQKGKYKTAQEYVNEATQYVKTKLDIYAQKKNAIPPLPDGARAETGSNRSPEPQKVDVVPSAEQELATRKEGMQKKIL